MTVRELVNKISEKTGVTPLPEEKTCDHLMTGSQDMEVKGAFDNSGKPTAVFDAYK